MEKIEKKIKPSNILYYTVVALFIIIVAISVSSKSQTAFNIIGYRAYTVLSGSMEPTYYPGDLVIVKNKTRAKLEEKDVITFIDDNEIVTHRIIEKTTEGYKTKGDNNDVEDAKLLKDKDIVGEVSFKIPKVGYVVQFLAKPGIVAIELILLGVFVLLYNRD
ncbi:signal peptidase I [Clostridium sp. CCUG 7971]|uniref:signal peptidase I n=1 Tax=Clostridium sp. CCUG 7971 TaxID=2811414 RepID=UPI001ABA077A|nr:signal peptidase I [Clostridium sp. CCUG 7971]MBO3444225.1 signal peptidase I [Clostridium sp. CCUG 7971]